MKRFRSPQILETLTLRPVCVFFAFFIVFGLISGVLFLYNSFRITEHDYHQKLHFLNQLQVQDTQMTLEQYETLLRITGNRLVEAGVDHNPELGRQAIESMKNVNTSLVALGLARADGQLILVSTIPAGVPLPNLLQQPKSRTGFKKVLSSQSLVLGRTYRMKPLTQWTVPMRVALRNNLNGEIHHVMTAGLPLTDKSTLWSQNPLANGIVTTVVRGDGYIQSINPHAGDPNLLFSAPLSPRKITQLKTMRNNPKVTTTLTSGMLSAVYYLPQYDLYILTEEPTTHLYAKWAKNSTPMMVVLFATGGLGFIVFRFISRLHQHAQAKIIFQATHDTLTELPNRQMMYDQVNSKIEKNKISQDQFAVLFLDLDNFKRINDNFGHTIGDDVLKEIAQRLLNSEDCEIVGRQGGDEFIVATKRIKRTNEIHRIARTLLKVAEETISIENYEMNLGTSIGVSLYPQDGDDASTLLRCADIALYKSKALKRGHYLFYSEEMNQLAQRRLRVEHQLRKCIQQQELTVHYQPLYNPSTNTISGCEALLRWTNHELGTVNPDEFVSVAEESGFIEELGLFVLERAIADIKQLNHQRKEILKVAINVSTKQLLYSPIIWHLQNLLNKLEVDPAMLKIEITESVLIEDFDRAIDVLRQIRQMGIQLSIDDFGTGYSSLAYLSKLPCEEIKIDRSFIQNILTCRDDECLIQSIIAMAKALNRNIVAEGVETAEQLEKLTTFGCDLIQGYYISRPIPLDEFSEFISQYD